ncbi:MAG TPA: DUF1983 domain-containing protein [Buttiauxella sp.]
MPAAIPIVAAVAAGSAAAAGMYAVAAVITIASVVASMALTKKPSAGSYRDPSERKQVLRAAASPKTVIYGETQSAGTLFFTEEEPGNQTKGERLFMAITLAGHPLSSISDIYLSDELISAYGANAEYEFHNNRTTVDPYMLENAPSWKEDMIGRGIAWLRVTLKFDAEKFPAGIPNIKVQKRGWALYDPRSGDTKYSNNAALVILHFYRHYLSVPDSEILWDQFIEAANICDERVSCADGTTEPRYTINGEFDLNENKSAVLDAFHASCAGEPTYIGGKHGLLVGAYYGPALDEINESQLAGDIEIMPEVSQRERVNTITGTFIDPLQGFAEVDFPRVAVAEWVAEDDGEIAQDMKLRFVTSEYQAQRLADIKLKRTRTARTLNLQLNLSGFRYRPGMYVMVNLPTLGINGVEMRVTDWSFSLDKGAQITLKQESAAVWNDAIGQPITRPPMTELPSGGVAQPQALAYTVEEIGEIVQGILSWQNIGSVAYNQVNIRQNGDVIMSVQAPGNITRLSGLIRGTYTAHVTAIGFTGARSPEAWTEFVIQAPDRPSNVRVDQGYFSVSLYPQMSQLTNVSTQFDFWTAGEQQLENSDTATVEHYATRAGLGSYWASHGLKNDHTYYWYVRSINAFGASGFVEVPALCQPETGELMDIIDQNFRDSDTYGNLQNGINTALEGIISNAQAVGDVAFHQWKQYGEITAEIMVVTTTIATVDEALAQLVLLVRAQFEGFESTILEVRETVANAEKAISTLDTYVQAQFQNTYAAINQKFEAYVKADGTAAAFYTLALGIERDGVSYNCGMAFGIEPKNGSYESSVIFAADRFGVYSGSTPNNSELVFSIENGQAYLRDVFIKDGSLENVKIGNEIYSRNYIRGLMGWYVNKDGYAEFNNVIVRGTVYATDGEFSGTVYASRIVGDVYSAESGTYQPYYYTGSAAMDHIIIKVKGEDFDRSLDSNLTVNLSTPWRQYFTIISGASNGVEQQVYYYDSGNNGGARSYALKAVPLPAAGRDGYNYIKVRVTEGRQHIVDCNFSDAVSNVAVYRRGAGIVIS